MKRAMSIIFFFLVSFSLYAAETGLYVKGGKRYEISQTYEVMNKIVQEQQSQKLLIFVHGRGRHPEKGIKIIDELEKRYKVKVLMFHWDSWINMWTRPVESAQRAGQELHEFLSRVNEYKKENLMSMNKVTMNMLVHSMGTIVYASMMDNYKYNFDSNLFHNVIMNEGDAQVFGHSLWLMKSDFQKNLYVTYNKRDLILRLSTKLDYGKRLGQGIEAGFFADSYYPWAKNAVYIDLTKVAGKEHKTYMMDKKSRYKPVLNFYQQIIRGEEFLLVEGNNVFKKKTRSEFAFEAPEIYELRR